MRALISLVAGFVIAAFVALASGGPVAYAAFHCVRIHAVLGSYNGNPNVQYVELRMDFASQVFLATHTIEFRDAAGTLKATFTFPAGTFPFGASVANFAVGDAILVATSEFNAAATGGTSDFVFTALNTVGANGGDPLHPVQGPGGKIGFAQGFDNCDADIIASPGEADSLAYGAATADFGTAAAPLPAAAGNAQGLRLSNLNTAPSNNHTEYSPQHVALSTSSVAQVDLATNLGTPRNNGRVILALPAIAPPATPTIGPPAVGGVAAAPDQLELPSRSATASSGHRTAYEVGAGALAAAAALGAAGWATRRKRSA
jgi:hypothetical protein